MSKYTTSQVLYWVTRTGNDQHLGHGSPLDDANKSSGAYEDPKWKTIFADSSSKTVESVIQGKWSPPGDPAKDRYGFAAIRRYGASKLCLAIMM